MRGSVRAKRLKDGRLRWEARWDGPPDPATGKRTQPSKMFDTKKEAERHLRRAIAEIEAGHVEPPGDVTVGDILISWLETEARHRVRPTTFYVYRNVALNHCMPGVGHLPLAKLTPAALQAWYSRLRSEEHTSELQS